MGDHEQLMAWVTAILHMCGGGMQEEPVSSPAITAMDILLFKVSHLAEQYGTNVVAKGLFSKGVYLAPTPWTRGDKQRAFWPAVVCDTVCYDNPTLAVLAHHAATVSS